MTLSYQKTLFPILTAEESARIPYLTERHIQALWFEQKYFKNLATSDNEKIEVVSPGMWNTEAGPDFLKAHLKIGNIEYKGDVEIHLEQESWNLHHHHEDQRYNSVILHLILWKNSKKGEFRKKNNELVKQAFLEDALTIPLSRMINLIDIDLYPYKKGIAIGKCSNKLFKKLDSDKTKFLLQSASYWRLEKKQTFLEERVITEAFRFPAGIAMALGYKNNSEAFLELFIFLTQFRDLPEEELFSIAMGCCGFFDKKIPKEWLQSEVYQKLRELWEINKKDILHQSQIRTDHARPLNHPLRRLVYIVKLLQDPKMENYEEKIMDFWEQESCKMDPTKKIGQLHQGLIDLIPTYQDSYWNYHYTFENKRRIEFLSLIGDNVKNEILINIILPVIYKREKLKNTSYHFELFYESLMTSFKKKSEYLAHRFFGDSKKSKLFRSAQLEQGAYQIHKDFCLHYEASCEGCPFVDHYFKCYLTK